MKWRGSQVKKREADVVGGSAAISVVAMLDVKVKDSKNA